LHNGTAKAVVVARIESSYPCIRLTPGSTRVEPDGDAEVEVQFDPAQEPDYRGALGVDLTGRDPAGAVVFRCRVDVTISEDQAISPAQ